MKKGGKTAIWVLLGVALLGLVLAGTGLALGASPYLELGPQGIRTVGSQEMIEGILAVSYTHLDVYKRQVKDGVDPGYPMVFGHSNAPEGAQALRELAAAHIDTGDIPLQLIGSVVGTHAGPGASGVVYVRKQL